MIDVTFMNFEVIREGFPFICEGVFLTFRFSVCALVAGFPLSIALSLAKVSKSRFLRSLSGLYTSIFRGTPLLVQFGFVYFAIPEVISVNLSVFEAGIVAFALNSAAYSSEIIRAGIKSIDQGQWEVSYVLGLSSFQTFRYVILPQAIRNIFPALINETVNLLKESALLSVFGELDIYKRAQIIGNQSYLYFEPLVMAACLYFVLVAGISFLAKKAEEKLKLC